MNIFIKKFMKEESNLALIMKEENNTSKLFQVKIIAPRHNQEKKSMLGDWEMFTYEKMKAKKIKR